MPSFLSIFSKPSSFSDVSSLLTPEVEEERFSRNLGCEDGHVVTQAVQLGLGLTLVYLIFQTQGRKLVTELRKLIFQIFVLCLGFVIVVCFRFKFVFKFCLSLCHFVKTFLKGLTAGQKIQQVFLHARNFRETRAGW